MRKQLNVLGATLDWKSVYYTLDEVGCFCFVLFEDTKFAI